MSLLSSVVGRVERPGGSRSRPTTDRRRARLILVRGPVRVQRVLAPQGGPVSWTVIGGDLRPVEPVERYLAWLSRIERSPNTVRAYAQDLKTFWEFLAVRGLRWDRVTLEQVGEFTRGCASRPRR